jgi:hypothetical protein
MDSTTDFLCEASEVFKLIWDTHREELRALAFVFNPDEKLCCSESRTNGLLYVPIRGSHRQARIDFLDHEILRLSQP